MDESQVIIGDTPGRTFTTTLITGPSLQVDNQVKEYFKDFHPNGYMTKIIKEEYIPETNGLMKRVRISRLSSCD